MNEMPRVGAKIRVTRTYTTGTTITREGVVTKVDLDREAAPLYVELADGIAVRMAGDKESTVTWVELEPPKSALLPEPDNGTIWLRPGTEERIDQVFLRADRAGTGWGAQDRWFGTASRQQSWEKLDIREGDELIRLVPVPDLAELVAAYRGFLEDLHAGHPGSLETCDYEECVECRPPLIRYETGATT